MTNNHGFCIYNRLTNNLVMDTDYDAILFFRTIIQAQAFIQSLDKSIAKDLIIGNAKFSFLGGNIQ